MISDYNDILEKAKNKYADALRCRDYQDELYSQDKFESHRMAIDDLVWKRQQYQTEINLLESLFGKEIKETK